MNKSTTDTSTQKNQVHIFICLTRFQFLMGKEILNSRSGKIIFIDVHGNAHNELKKEIEYHALTEKIKPNNLIASLYKVTREYQHVRKVIDRCINPAQMTYIYLPHLGHILCNHIFFRYRRSETVNFSIIQDGTANFYGPQVFPRLFLKLCLRSLLAATIGLSARPFLGYLTGGDRPEITRQFILPIRGADFQAKSEFVYLNMNYRTCSNVLVIEEIHDIHEEAILEKILAYVARIKLPEGSARYIKQRNPLAAVPQAAYVKRMKGLGFRCTPASSCAEESIRNLGVNMVIGCLSSALLNISATRPDIRVISCNFFDAGWSRNFPKEATRLHAVFAENGIEFLNL